MSQTPDTPKRKKQKKRTKNKSKINPKLLNPQPQYAKVKIKIKKDILPGEILSKVDLRKKKLNKKIPFTKVELTRPIVQVSSTRKANAAKLIQEKFRKLKHDLKKASKVSRSRRKNKLRCKDKFDAMKNFLDTQENSTNAVYKNHRNTPHYVEKAKKYKNTIPVRKYMACMGDSPFTPTLDDISYFRDPDSISSSRSRS